MKLGKEVGLGDRQIVLNGDPAPVPQRGTSLPNFWPCPLWPNGWINQDTAWYGGRPWPRLHCVRWGPSSPPLKGHNPQFSAHACCGETVGWIKMPLGREVCVRWGPTSPPIKGHSPQFSAHVYCGQTVAHLSYL